MSLIIKKDGYSNLVVKCPCDGLSYAISPVMDQNLDGMRIVLNWGAQPSDLDSHLVHPSTHVFFSDKQGDLANLDVDDTTSYGPETVTLEKKKTGVKYLYAVHNYTEGDKKGSLTLSNNSQAKVFVYVGSSLVRTFTPPKARPATSGWCSASVRTASSTTSTSSPTWRTAARWASSCRASSRAVTSSPCPR